MAACDYIQGHVRRAREQVLEDMSRRQRRHRKVFFAFFYRKKKGRRISGLSERRKR